MVFDLIEQCVKRCECYSLLKSGELVFRGDCEKCTLRYEQIVFGAGNKKIKLEFEEFKKLFNLIKKIGFSAINYIQLDIKVNEDKTMNITEVKKLWNNTRWIATAPGL